MWYAKQRSEQMVAQNKGGKIVVTSSARSKMGNEGIYRLLRLKGRVRLDDTVHGMRLAPYHINVNTINPTVFRSDLTEWCLTRSLRSTRTS
jgi:NAD(P)-dependent dehydrogenase (short-subunit alcohol dehydrogenase family)